MNIESMKIGQTHVVWSSLESTISDVRKGITKSRMLTGTSHITHISSTPVQAKTASVGAFL